MWILLNNKPVNVLQKLIVEDIIFIDTDKLEEKFRTLLKEPSYYIFSVHTENNTIYSKHYKTREEAEEARNNLLLQINKTLATLPKVEI